MVVVKSVIIVTVVVKVSLVPVVVRVGMLVEVGVGGVVETCLEVVVVREGVSEELRRVVIRLVRRVFGEVLLAGVEI